MGAEAGGDWIASNNLGDHALARTSLFRELQWSFGKTATVYPGLRFDYYSNFGASVNPSLSGSWWILPRIRLRSSVGRAFRIPTFTELYYRDPNHEATSSLKPESAWSAEIGTDFIPAKNWLGSFTFFSRKEQNVIDWIRRVPSRKMAHRLIFANLHRAGAEIGVEHSLGSRAASAKRTTAGFRSMRDAIDYTSKYVLDYARAFLVRLRLFSASSSLPYQQTASYKRRADGRSYWILDGRLERHFHQFVASVDLTNMLNSEYQEDRGVDMPGRWFVTRPPHSVEKSF